jgi:outer membrane protein OmpA-like peptidoglycan-associated protein
MPAPDSVLFAGAAMLALAGLAACGSESAGTGSAPEIAPVECVTIPEGVYIFENGRFTATAAALKTPAPDRVIPAPTGWAGELQTALGGAGFPWIGVSIRQNVAALTGTAPSQYAREQGFATGKTAIESDPIGGEEVTLIADAIGTETGPRAPGEALVTLMNGAISLTACQQALTDTMQGQKIQFPTNVGDISPASYALVDAVAGIAMLCDEYPIEVGAHTDLRGSDEFNLVLSQKRADAVRQYLLERGVDTDQISAVGYGESRPLDTADTLAAFDRNARIEFKARRRP